MFLQLLQLLSFLERKQQRVERRHAAHGRFRCSVHCRHPIRHALWFLADGKGGGSAAAIGTVISFWGVRLRVEWRTRHDDGWGRKPEGHTRLSDGFRREFGPAVLHDHRRCGTHGIACAGRAAFTRGLCHNGHDRLVREGFAASAVVNVLWRTCAWGVVHNCESLGRAATGEAGCRHAAVMHRRRHDHGSPARGLPGARSHG